MSTPTFASLRVTSTYLNLVLPLFNLISAFILRTIHVSMNLATINFWRMHRIYWFTFKFMWRVLGGGGALLREKMVEVVSDKFICIVDESKLSKVSIVYFSFRILWKVFPSFLPSILLCFLLSSMDSLNSILSWASSFSLTSPTSLPSMVCSFFFK